MQIWNFIRLSSGVSFAFISTFLLLLFKPFSNKLLGHDRGRMYVIGSEVNKGKFTGVGIYFVTTYIISVISFSYCSLGIFIMMNFLALSSLFGFLDDRAINPWGEILKGGIDFLISLLASFSYVLLFSTTVISPIGEEIYIHPVVYALLAVALFIVSINATNATDGVDGLSGTLTIITIFTLMIVSAIRNTLGFNGFILGLLMIVVLIPYLFFNKYPSKVLMGDAGSRAIGFLIAFYAMYLRIPFTYLIIGLPFMLDGGLSILKITIGRITNKIFHRKIIILKSLITPIHDHLKQAKHFSVKKTYYIICLFAIIVDSLYVSVLGLIRLIDRLM